MWALCTRSDPRASTRHHQARLVRPARPGASSPSARRAYNSRLIIDASRPYEWRDEFPPVNTMKPETARKAYEQWGWLVGKTQQ